MLGLGIWITTQDTEYKHLAGNLVSNEPRELRQKQKHAPFPPLPRPKNKERNRNIYCFDNDL